MTNTQVFQYLDLAVRSIGRSRQHYALNAADRDRHHHEMLEVLFALESTKALMGQGYPQSCFSCGVMIASPDDHEWHGLGNCVDICERCGGSGEEPKVQKGEVCET